MAVKKLLVADDSLTIQKVIRLALSSEGYDIQSVSDGNDALQQIALIRPDVVLIDVSLPGKTAFDVKRALNREVDLQFVRFVLMSSAFEQVDETQAQEVLFHGRLIKPFDPAHLRDVIQKVLATVPERDPDFSTFVSPKQTSGEEPTKFPIFSTYADNTPPLAVNPPAPEVVHQAQRAASLPESPYRQPDEDIRQLTDSTMHMSGMSQSKQKTSPPQQSPLPPSSSDDGWAVQERSLRDFAVDDKPLNAPAPTPPGASTFATQKTKYIEIPTFDEPAQPAPLSSAPRPRPPVPPAGLPPYFEEEPTLNPDYPLVSPRHQPMPPPTQPPSSVFGSAGNTAGSGITDREDITNPMLTPGDAMAISAIAPGTPSLADFSSPPMSSSVTARELEEVVRRQLEERLEEMAKRLLPEVAEKIIRQEIQKLLQEQP